MAGGNLLNLGGFLGSNGDPSQFNLSAAANAVTGGSSLFDPGSLGKYVVTQVASSLPYTSGLAKNQPRTWQLVKLDAASGSTFGSALVWLDYTDYIVTTVASTAKPNDVAGLLLTGSITTAGAVTSLTHDAVNGNFVFILTDGIAPYLSENAGVGIIGAQVFAGATTAGRFDEIAVNTAAPNLSVGTALTAKAALFQGITTVGDYAHGNFRFPSLLQF